MGSERWTERARRAAPAALVAIFAALLWRPLLGLELYGWDTFPLILASRVDSLPALVGTFGEELMDGHFPLGRFYRPLTHLSFGVDHLLFGLEPFGYRLTDLALVVAGAALVAELGRRWTGSSLAGALGGALFAAHPILFEVLPIPARRAETLSITFVLAALVVAAGAPRQGARAGWWLALWTASAVAAKETGIVALPLALLAVWLRGVREPRAARGLFVPPLVATGAVLVVRTIVLGGLGGSPRASLGGGLTRAPDVALRYAELILVPGSVQDGGGGTRLAAGAGLVVLAVGAALAARDPRAPRGFARFLGGWLLVLVAVTGVSGLNRAWYALPYLPIFALAVAGLVAACARALRHGAAWRALGFGAASAAFVLAPALERVGSPRPRETAAAAADAADLIARFGEAVSGMSPGETRPIDAAPSALGSTRAGRRTSRVVVLPDYALEALAELRMPDARVRVTTRGRTVDRPPGPTDRHVELVPGALAGE